MELLENILGIEVEYEAWGKQNKLPLYIAGNYEFQIVRLNDCQCLMLTPVEELVTIPALKKQIKRIQEIENVPIVLKLTGISYYRRKNLIENRIPFITNKQIYLPFMGTYLQKENEEPQVIEKVMFSTQMLILMYLYHSEEKLYISDATKKLPFSAMTMSRAVKQIEAIGLFHITKDGVSKVIESKYNKKELYEKVKGYLTSPVRKTGYIEKEMLTEDMVPAGETVLAEKTMLNYGMIKTYAVCTKKFDKKLLINELVNPEKQYRLEVWEYEPKFFSDDDMADEISVALSVLDTEDERIEEAVEELLENRWE